MSPTAVAAIVSTNVLEAVNVAWDESTVGILSVLVFGAGTDYALLLISRYRDELKTTSRRYEAMGHALRRTFEAVLSSSTTVVLGVLTLLLSAIPTTRGLGLACAVGVVIAATFALVVLPAALVLSAGGCSGRACPTSGTPSWWTPAACGAGSATPVARRPRTFVAATVAGLAVLSIGRLYHDRASTPPTSSCEQPEAIAAAERLGESFPAGTSDVQVGHEGRAEGGPRHGGEGGRRRLGARHRTGDGIARIDAVPDASPGSDEAKQVVLDVRDGGRRFDDTHVGGGDAESIDEQDARRARPAGDLAAHPAARARRAAPAAALARGAAAARRDGRGDVRRRAWARRGGSSQRVFGFEAMDTGVPLLAFLFLVALGVDYNIFLVTRAREEAREHGTRTGMLRALTATGGVITSAGILLAAVFAVLGVLPLVVLAQLGAIIFVGVLLDTLVVRTVLVPALALTLGDTFWWPRKVGPT